ncbi:bifunctional glutamine synthetase adenylyltransferase/adenylyl-removing enzyme [bacterium MnTg02]|nr:bifunctional glutamine synthetase adenylyltransferase/adenylyl-removing enzyme [bacterium MnTg02]
MPKAVCPEEGALLGGLYEKIATVPPVYLQDKAEAGLSDLLSRVDENVGLSDLSALVSGNEKVRSLLGTIFGASPYLSHLILADPAFLHRSLVAPPDETLSDLIQALDRDMGAAENAGEVMTHLRTFKKRVALLTALSDIAGIWDVMQTTEALSQAADNALKQAVRFAFRVAAQHGAYHPSDPDKPEQDSGYFVLALGKYGALELNYSSDIDLIIFYDPERLALPDDAEPAMFCIRLTRELVRFLQERTQDGYVYRVDLRLRPDPGATQVAMSTEAGLIYYESFGQNWERAALIKARSVAGDIFAGKAFLDQLSPFVWRKYLDFAAIADVHAMKRQIHAVKGHGDIAVAGHNIKLGRGGIREIEFFVQTQQLIAGGRQEDLRSRKTLQALDLLAEKGWIKSDVAVDLGKSYRFLRHVEHRLQMVGDEQTHTLPKEGEELEQFAFFAGFSNSQAFATELIKHLEIVQAHYAALFEDAPVLASETGNLVFTGDENDTETVATLKSMGFASPERVIAAVRSWHFGRYPAMRSERARERLTEVQPILLEAFSKSVDPDVALVAFDRFLADLPAGVQLFSLLRSHPHLLRLIADIMGTAPRLARILSRRARLLDAVLDPGFFGALPSDESLSNLVENQLSACTDYQEGLDLARSIGQEQAFLIGVRVVSGTITADEAGGAYARLAGHLINALSKSVQNELAKTHGKLAGGEVAIIALGKLGGMEMTGGSDLDLIIVYDFDERADMSDGLKPLTGGQYYARFAQRFIAALSVPTAQGTLYEVDMRLRPSGRSGPLATRLQSFVDYQNKSAWTWEHMALTRARIISGPPGLRERIEATIRNVLSTPRNAPDIAADIVKMRQLIDKEKGTSDIWSIKEVSGGLIDLEFITQFLQLVHAEKYPGVLDQNTFAALKKLVATNLIKAADADVLIPAARLYHNLTQVLRLCVEGSFSAEEASDGLKLLLVQAGEEPDFLRLEACLSETLTAVRKIYDALIVSRATPDN